MRRTAEKRRFLVWGGLCLLTALSVLGGGTALADAVDGVTQTAGDAVDGVTQTAGDAVDGVTQTAGDAVDGVTQTAGDAVDGVTQTAGDAVDGVTTTGSGGALSASGDSLLEEEATVSGAELGIRDRQASDAAVPMLDGERTVAARVPDDLRGPASSTAGPVGIPRTIPLAEQELRGEGVRDDPCEHDARLVCLGLLYGLGSFAETGAEVLGALVTTGAAGVLGLMVLAAVLWIIGAALLAASSRRQARVVRRAV